MMPYIHWFKRMIWGGKIIHTQTQFNTTRTILRKVRTRIFLNITLFRYCTSVVLNCVHACV